MSSAPEQDIVTALNAMSLGMGTFYLDEWPRGNVKMPLVIVQLIGDSNEKRMLSSYGGVMRLQFDIYNKVKTPELRKTLKDALRGLRGTVGDMRHVWIVITNELSTGADPAGGWRWTVDADVMWEEAAT